MSEWMMSPLCSLVGIFFLTFISCSCVGSFRVGNMPFDCVFYKKTRIDFRVLARVLLKQWIMEYKLDKRRYKKRWIG